MEIPKGRFQRKISANDGGTRVSALRAGSLDIRVRVCSDETQRQIPMTGWPRPNFCAREGGGGSLGRHCLQSFPVRMWDRAWSNVTKIISCPPFYP